MLQKIALGSLAAALGALAAALVAAPALARDSFGTNYARNETRYSPHHHRNHGAWIGNNRGHAGVRHGGHWTGHDQFSPRGQGGHHWGW